MPSPHVWLIIICAALHCKSSVMLPIALGPGWLRRWVRLPPCKVAHCGTDCGKSLAIESLRGATKFDLWLCRKRAALQIHRATTRLFLTENTPGTPFARMLAMFLSA